MECHNGHLGGGFKYVLFSPRKLEKMNPICLAHIFQMAWWFNHQTSHKGHWLPLVAPFFPRFLGKKKLGFNPGGPSDGRFGAG